MPYNVSHAQLVGVGVGSTDAHRRTDRSLRHHIIYHIGNVVGCNTCYTDYVPYAAYEADCGDIIVRNIDTVGRKCPYSIRGNGASDGFEETIVFNLVISLALIIYMVMAAVRHMPTILALMSIATITSAYLYTDGKINRQIVVIFVIVEIFTCILGEMIRRGIRSMQRENADYHSTLNRVLSTFHMTKTELLAYIQLGRGEQSDKDITDFFDHLDERTEANLIRAVEQRVAQRKMQHADISAVLPTLTPTEQEVCRLIIGGKTIIEIASILHKNANNVSSVRIHIRKKLGLATGKDLREALLEVMQRK